MYFYSMLNIIADLASCKAMHDTPLHTAMPLLLLEELKTDYFSLSPLRSFVLGKMGINK